MIIGLSGYARSGKDTVAGMLIGIHRFERVSFADPIKDFIYELNPMWAIAFNGQYKRISDYVDEYGWDEAKVNIPEIRELLQRLGVAARKHIDESVWITSAFNKAKDKPRIVVTDVRFKNEAAKIKEAGGQIWRVTRVGTKPANDHISEVDMDDWEFDATITNNSDMPNLIKQIRALIG